jgi:hypothetical protein
LFGGLPHQRDPTRVVGDLAVREIQPDDIHARAHDLAEDLRIVRGRAESGDYLRSP